MKLNEFIYGLTLTTPANLTRPINILSDIGHSNPWLLGYIDDVLRIAVGLYQQDTPVEYFYMEAITGLIGNFMIHTLAPNEAIGLFNLSDTTLAAARHQNALKSAVYSGASPRSALINMSKPDLGLMLGTNTQELCIVTDSLEEFEFDIIFGMAIDLIGNFTILDRWTVTLLGTKL